MDLRAESEEMHAAFAADAPARTAIQIRVIAVTFDGDLRHGTLLGLGIGCVRVQIYPGVGGGRHVRPRPRA
jgi:hypothetical protein